MKLPSLLLIAGAMSAMSLAAQSRTGVVRDSLPGMRMAWELVEVPAGTVVLDVDGRVDTVAVERFLIGRTEVPWELFDIFYLRLDVARDRRDSVDVRMRPSRPYGAPDRGFGHRGYPVISVTHGAATRFALWLSERTGQRYAVATDAQWQRAADLAFPDGALATPERAITAANSDGATHPIGALAPDRLGLYDLLGNAGEWVTGMDGTPWLRGGAYTDPAVRVTRRSRALQQPSWNQTDPQIPKSRWWLSDGPFAGIRLVRTP